MEGAEEEEEEEDSSGKSPDIPDVDLKKRNNSSSQTDERAHINSFHYSITPCFTLKWVPAWTRSSVACLDWDTDQDWGRDQDLDWDWDCGWGLG